LQSLYTGGIMKAGKRDMSAEQTRARTDGTTVPAGDIDFECPACGKSLIVDEAAEGMIVDCPQCRTNVIVPPKSVKAEPLSTAAKHESTPSEHVQSGPGDAAPQKRLATLAGQLKEIQAQRTEVTNRIATRLNEVNRDLVMIARLETSQQQILKEWIQLVEKISPARPAVDPASSKPTVIGASVADIDRMRVPFRKDA
jgi:DNA-directed RNA polymerase subunit M/transcription elongation factor TFIIS